MGHLQIVNLKTLPDVLKTGFISGRGDLKKYVGKTIADLFSDVLAVRKGDYIFPWIVREGQHENMGFKYVFKVAGPPIYVKGDPFPIKVPLQEEYWESEASGC